MVHAAAVQGFIIQHTYYMVLIIVKKIQFQINMDKQSINDEFDLDHYLCVVANVLVVETFIYFFFSPFYSFQYILGAATSPAVKLNEETLTYLNQGQLQKL